jgi:hypothetical protein
LKELTLTELTAKAGKLLSVTKGAVTIYITEQAQIQYMAGMQHGLVSERHKI